MNSKSRVLNINGYLSYRNSYINNKYITAHILIDDEKYFIFDNIQFFKLNFRYCIIVYLHYYIYAFKK